MNGGPVQEHPGGRASVPPKFEAVGLWTAATKGRVEKGPLSWTMPPREETRLRLSPVYSTF